MFKADGVRTPKYFVADRGMNGLNYDSMKFPLIVKPRHEGSSKGIFDDSVVSNRKELRDRIEKIIKTYQQSALVEEFISGMEFTVLVIGNGHPKALPSVQIEILGKVQLGNLTYTSRRLDNTDVDCICPAKISRVLEKKIGAVAIKAYQTVGCRDFGRVDIRVDSKGCPYVLEVNPLPSLSPEDIFPPVAVASGMTYDELVVKIIDIALKRYGLTKKRRKN